MKGKRVDIIARYAKILTALDRDQDAFDKLEQAIKSGRATEDMSTEFKTLYIKTKGSEAGYNAYAELIRKGVLENLKRKLASEILKERAAEFVLTDLNGKNVSLKSLKGKVVVLDFWATWCGPCKASFPAMQLAIDKYKADPNVVFLFIHTWERSTTPTQDAEAYISQMKYDFEVLLDIKDAYTKVNKVVDSYKVSGIPAKFIIDGEGNIRFKLTGFDGSKAAAVDELTTMITMAKETI